jgi:hypothetical protein
MVLPAMKNKSEPDGQTLWSSYILLKILKTTSYWVVGQGFSMLSERGTTEEGEQQWKAKYQKTV